MFLSGKDVRIVVRNGWGFGCGS